MPALPRSAEARIVHERELARRRKAAERNRLRDLGRPDAAALDRAIADALRTFLSVDDRSLTRPLDPRALLTETMEQLRQRSARAQESGRDEVVYDARQVVDALKNRLLVAA